MKIALLVSALFGILVMYYLYMTTRIPDGMPDGPMSLPLIGYPGLAKKPIFQMVRDLHDEYGPLFTVKLGRIRPVFIGDFYVIKEVFNMNATTQKPVIWYNRYFRFGTSKGSSGLAFRR